MNVLLWLSVFWILYGIAGLFGIQNIPAKYQGHSWTKDYIRSSGISWLMLGVPLLIFERILRFCYADVRIGAGTYLLIAFLLALPSLIFTHKWEKKYKALLANNV